MAISHGYCTLVEIKARLDITGTAHDTELEAAVEAATAKVDAHCRRRFSDSGSATARVFNAESNMQLWVDDFSTTTGLEIATDSADDGTFSTTWASTDFELWPWNGVMDGLEGWPYCRIHAVGDYLFPRHGRRLGLVQVTARWGWAAVPEPVSEATLILAAEMFKLREAPFGVAGFGELGLIRVRDNPKVANLLDVYRSTAVRL